MHERRGDGPRRREARYARPHGLPAERAGSAATRRLHVGVAALGATVLITSGCAQLANTLPGTAHDDAEAAGRPCAALAVRSCALPYPSDEFTVDDASSSTGKRVVMPAELIADDAVEALGPGAHPSDAFDGADGFSALSPVIFELDRPVRPESLPADGGDVFVVLDESTGQRQQIRAEVWNDAAFRGAPATIVMAWPVTTWEYGHTYVAGVRGLSGLVGDPRPPAALTDPDPTVAGILERFESASVGPRSSFQSVTRFSVGSRGSVTAAMHSMAAAARAEDHPVRHLRSNPPLLFDHGAATITGEVRTTDFRDSDGVVHPDSPTGHEWVRFVLAVPERADDAPAPVAIYGHGLTINKESMLVVASQNAAHGVATIGIDVPNHGSRQAGQGGYLLDLMNPGDLGRLAGMPLQGIIDHVSLTEAIVDHLSDVDLAPWRPFDEPGDGTADLDTDLLLYEGTSMGGVLGAGEFALIPRLDAAFLQVPGAGIVDTLAHSWLWPLFSSIIPASASAGDAAALLGAASMLLDRADPTHLLDDLRRSGRPVIAQVGVGDRIVPEFSSDRLVRMLGLPRIGTQRTGIVASGHIDSLGPDGRGFEEVWPLHSSPVSMGLMGHLAFGEPAAKPLLDQWLTQRVGGVHDARGRSGLVVPAPG